MRRFFALPLLLAVAACGNAESKPKDIPSALHYDCEGHRVDIDNEAAIATLRKANGDKVMQQVTAESGVKYQLPDADKNLSFSSKADETTLTLGKKSFKCSVAK